MSYTYSIYNYNYTTCQIVTYLLTSVYKNRIYYPFKEYQDYDFSKKFSTNNISKTKINNYLRSPFNNSNQI